MIRNSAKGNTGLKQLLETYGISIDRPGIYEFAPISLPWFSNDFKTNIEIELIKDEKNKGYVFHVLLVPDFEGIVERTVVLAAEMDTMFDLKNMFIDRKVREHLIPDIDGIDFSENHNAYVIKDSTIFLTTLETLLNQLTTREPIFF